MTAHEHSPSATSRRAAPPRSDDDVTRKLSGRTYLDPDFARTVADELAVTRYRAVAPSYGFDAVPVVVHALRARSWALNTVIAVTVVVVVSIVVSPFGALVGLANVLSLVALVRTVIRARQRRWSSVYVYAIILVVVVPVLTISAYTLLFAAAGGAEFGPLAGGGGVALVGATFVLSLLVLQGGSYAAVLVHRLLVARTLAEDLRPRASRVRYPEPPPALRRRVAGLATAQRSTVTVYSDDALDHPFLGAGDVLTSWAYVVDLVPTPGGQPDGRPDGQKMDAPGELLSGLRTVFDDPTRADAGTLDIDVAERAYVSGSLTSAERETIDPQEPERSAATIFREWRDRSPGRTRVYQTVQFTSWDGDLVVTAFARAAVRGSQLSVEFASTALPPVATGSRRLDSVWAFNALTVLREIAVTLWAAPVAVADAPRHLWLLAAGAGRRSLDTQNLQVAANQQAAFDYGARVSIREVAGTWPGLVSFPELDAVRQTRLAERGIHDVVRRMLRTHGWSTAEFEQRVSTITNVTMTNPVFRNSAVALGSASMATAAATTQPGGGMNGDR